LSSNYATKVALSILILISGQTVAHVKGTIHMAYAMCMRLHTTWVRSWKQNLLATAILFDPCNIIWSQWHNKQTIKVL